jgi:hypothetical protein
MNEISNEYLKGIGTNHKKAFEDNLNRTASAAPMRSKLSNKHDWKTETTRPATSVDARTLLKNENRS